MSHRRALLALPAIALLLAGCELRGSADRVVAEEQAAETGRQADENAQLRNENIKLKTQLDQAREELRNRAGGSIGVELGGLGPIEGVEMTGDGGIALSDDFTFAKGSADVTGDGKRALAKIAAKLNEGELAGTVIVVEGHTDQTPVSRASTKEKFVDNLGLSAARSAAVVRELIAAGVAVDRIRPTFYGEHKPRATGSGKDAQAKNRRVELRVQR